MMFNPGSPYEFTDEVEARKALIDCSYLSDADSSVFTNFYGNQVRWDAKLLTFCEMRGIGWCYAIIDRNALPIRYRPSYLRTNNL